MEFVPVLLPYGITRRSNMIMLILKFVRSFTTLWNYTTLKPSLGSFNELICFTTLWNYTTLKQRPCLPSRCASFTTLWNYTTLKL